MISNQKEFNNIEPPVPKSNLMGITVESAQPPREIEDSNSRGYVARNQLPSLSHTLPIGMGDRNNGLVMSEFEAMLLAGANAQESNSTYQGHVSMPVSSMGNRIGGLTRMSSPSPPLRPQSAPHGHYGSAFQGGQHLPSPHGPPYSRSPLGVITHPMNPTQVYNQPPPQMHGRSLSEDPQQYLVPSRTGSPVNVPNSSYVLRRQLPVPPNAPGLGGMGAVLPMPLNTSYPTNIGDSMFSFKSYSHSVNSQQMERQRRRKENHNLVERRRRDHINEMIHRLGTLIPVANNALSGLISIPGTGSASDTGSISSGTSPLTVDSIGRNSASISSSLKLNKGDILQRSVEYIMWINQVLEEQNRRLAELDPKFRPACFEAYSMECPEPSGSTTLRF